MMRGVRAGLLCFSFLLFSLVQLSFPFGLFLALVMTLAV